jgi:nicotinamidase-related amidase
VVTEYCVRYAAEGLLHRGHRVALVTDAIQPLDAAEGGRVIEELTARGARKLTTAQALALIS